MASITHFGRENPPPSWMMGLAALLFCGFFFTAPAQAQSFGLAMRGAPKYGPSTPQLDYTDPAARKGGVLRQAAIGTFDTLNPFSINGPAAKGLELVYDPLMRRVWDEPFTLYPLVADRVDVPADRSGITFHIDPRARFSDGSPITAADVLFSWQTLRDHGRPNMRSEYRLATGAEMVDSRTVKFTFGPGFDRETAMIFAIMPVLSKAWWQGRNFDATFLTLPVTNGPYRIRSVDPGHQIVFARDPAYWARDMFPNKGLYNFESVIYDYYRDDTVAFEGLKAGNLNFRREMNPERWATGYDFPAIQAGSVLAEAIPHQRPELARGLVFNTRRAPFDDPKVREALEYVGDFDWINRTLFSGKYTRITSYFPNSTLAAQGLPTAEERAILDPWRASLPPDAFGPAWQPPATGNNESIRDNLRHADGLLRQAGWIVVDGVRVRKDDPGKIFKFEIILDAATDEKIALAFVNGLRRLGIDATIRVLDSAQFSERTRTYNYDMVLEYWSNTLSPGTEQMRYWGCAAANAPGGFNFAGVCNPAVDAVARSIANAATEDELHARAHALDRILTHGHYMIPLFYAGKDFVAHDATLRHPAVEPLYGITPEAWWADPGRDKKRR